ncbi:MAG: hypothetical protein V1776_01195 [Candidatus Diapherotrites archaeon]
MYPMMPSIIAARKLFKMKNWAMFVRISRKLKNSLARIAKQNAAHIWTYATYLLCRKVKELLNVIKDHPDDAENKQNDAHHSNGDV